MGLLAMPAGAVSHSGLPLGPFPSFRVASPSLDVRLCAWSSRSLLWHIWWMSERRKRGRIRRIGMLGRKGRRNCSRDVIDERRRNKQTNVEKMQPLLCQSSTPQALKVLFLILSLRHERRQSSQLFTSKAVCSGVSLVPHSGHSLKM